MEMPHPCTVVSLYRSHRKPPRGGNAASAQAASPAGVMFRNTGSSRKVLTLSASGGLMFGDGSAVGQWIEGNVMAVRSCSWNTAMMTKRKKRMGRNTRTLDDWGKDGCIA